MASRAIAGRLRRFPTWALLLLIAGLLLWGFPASQTGAASHSPIHATHAVPPASAVSHSASQLVRPASPLPNTTTNVSIGTVYNSTLIAPASVGNEVCYWQNYTFDHYQYCFPETQNPSIVSLSGGHLGLGYSIYTTAGPLCNTTTNTTLASWTATSVAWADSSTNGTSWTAPTIVGGSTCQWPSSSEPTFAAGSSSSVDGAFILSNQTVNASSFGGSQPLFPPDWSNVTGDAIGFVNSTNNGATWSTTSVVPGITGAARPQIAVFGNTIYIAYIFVPNTPALYPIGNYFGSSPALEVQLVYSANGGTTWNGPYTLPGQNASFGNWSTSPSIAVSSGGTVAVGYATNRSCVQYCSYPIGAYYGDSIVVATSTTNGTSWAAPVSVGPLVGETPYAQNYYDNYYPSNMFPWQTIPQTSIAYSSPTTLYLAYDGGYVKSTTYTYSNYQSSGVFASVSTNGGTTWNESSVNAPLSTSNYDDVYSPAVGVSGGVPYVAYVWQNNTYCSTFPCSPFVGGYSSWIATTTNGVNWTSTYSGISRMPGSYYADAGWQGWSSGVAFTAAGAPVTATTLPGKQSFQYVGLYNSSIPVYAITNYANVSIGYQYTGPTTSAVFVEHNLTGPVTWGITVDGYPGITNGTTINVTNVPLHVGVLIAVLPQQQGYRVSESSSLSVPSYTEFNGPTVVDVNYSIGYGISISLEPAHIPYAYISMSYGGTYYDIYSSNAYMSVTPAMPWYFPAGVHLEFLSTYGEPPITYWNGTGPGSYTGPGSDLNLTLSAPVNETAWAGSYGVYNEGFHANGLPSTSVYSFHFNGANYSASANTWLNVSNVGTGGYTVSSITANSSQSGWEYFGWIPGGSNVVVVPSEPTVGFDFAFVNVSAPVGLVTFQAMGIGNGTVWSVQFNGTYYSSSVTTLTVSTRPGTFPWAVGSAVAANASVGYAPVGTGGTVTVTTGSTVNIAYTSAYRVDVIAGVGGSVSGAGNHWLASGASMTYSAVASTGYTFGGWTGTGTGSYTGSNVNATVTVGGALTETASFYPLPSDRFNVTFQQSTIPTGTPWTVYLNGVGYSSNTTTLTVSNLLSCAAGVSGQYHESVPYAYDGATGASRYAAVSPPSQFCTNGGFVQTLTFAPQYQVTVSATPGGSAYLADANVQSNQSVWAGPTDTVQLTAIPALGYAFGGWNGTGSGSYTGGSISPPISAGGPVTEFATFVPLPPVKHPTYSETFVSSVAFAAGTTWSVKVQSASYAGVGPKIVVSNLAPATYTVTVSVATASDGLTRWSPTGSPFPIHVTANGSQTVTFGKPSYWVTIGGSSGGTESPASGWYATGAPLNLNATVDAGQTFVSWAGTGTGNYTGNLSATQLTVLGPITEFATFQPLVKAATVVTSFWSSTTTWAILGLVGVLVGLIVGIAVRRFRTAPATATNEPMRPWTSGETGTTESGGGSPSGGTP